MKRILPALFSLIFFQFSFGQATFQKDNLNPIKIFLQEHLTDLHLKSTDVQNLEITDQHLDKTGIQFLYIRQQLAGRPVFPGVATLAMKGDSVVHIASRLIANLSYYSTEFKSTPNDIQSVLHEWNHSFPDSLNVISSGSYQWRIVDEKSAEYPIEISQGFQISDEKLIPAYRVFWVTKGASHSYEIFINAGTSEIISAIDLVVSCSFDNKPANNVGLLVTPNVNLTEQTQATESYNVFPWPVESPNHGNRSVVTSPADNASSPFGWHDDNGAAGAEYTITRGNNVWARDDKDNNDTGGSSPDGGSSLTFNAPFDINNSATLELDAATINLFYWNNLMHDVWYHYGFDDAAGNFQQNNYGRGGTGNDFVFADAQDGSGTNNANFNPLPEGQNPRMQMYLWATAGQEKMRVTSPSQIQGVYAIVQAGFGNKKLSKTPVSGKLVLVNDGTASPTLACSPLQNSTDISGNIAVIDRGGCNFDDKVLYAQNAGAIAVVMINNVSGSAIVMGGDATNVNIPSVMISKADGDLLKSTMSTNSVVVKLYDSTGGSTFYYDSDFDNGVICHEYTHGISTRLTGGASNSSCLSNQEQMGEGWSDFVALVMTVEPGDQGTDKRGIGTYVIGEPTSGNGIRPYPYSTDMNLNPVTYADVKLNQFTVPHGVGSIWCSMLWDLYWAFVDQYGYDNDIYTGTGGNNMAMQLMTYGLKLQPCGPGFVDGRDAILKADELLFNSKNKLLIWQVFARRGLGFSADQGSANSRYDGIEAFDIPSSFGTFEVEKSGPDIANAGDTVFYEIKIRNTGTELLKQVRLSDSLMGKGTYLQSDGRCAIAFSDANFVLNFNNLNPGDSITCGYQVIIDTTFGGNLISADSFDGILENWTITLYDGDNIWKKDSSRSTSGKYCFHVLDAGSQNDVTFWREFDLSKIANPKIRFSHWYQTETNWDGAVVEIYDRGSWVDLGSRMVQNGYSGKIESNPESAISGRNAFTGSSDDFVQTIINLKDYAGNVVKIRFRMVSDGRVGAEGWYLDDVELWNNLEWISNSFSATADGLKAKTTGVSTFVRNQVVQDTTVIIVIDVNEIFKVYPNPFQQDISVYLESKVDRTVKLELYNEIGQIIWNGAINSNQEIQIPTGGNADGIYILRVNDRGEIKNLKLVKQGG
ncbi:MAG: T9SS type A sorting domain-containing protein [Bacteroidetes bacterium]|nr:T9SS type A sorting domain-containing protein [Bacteroidota bacterium]